MCIVTGRRHAILFAELADGAVPGKEFFESLAPETQAKFYQYFKHVAENGIEGAFNHKRFRSERKPYYAFKGKGWRKGGSTRDLIRFPCFCHNKQLVITHGFCKPRQRKWPETEFTRADEIREAWLRLHASDV